MVSSHKYGTAFLFVFASLLVQSVSAAPVGKEAAKDIVHGNLIQFHENGAWCWYQDERAIIDLEQGQFLIGSTSSRVGIGGKPVDGNIDVTFFDLATGARKLHTIGDLESYGACDDHNVPALLKKQDGNILAFYAPHNNLNRKESGKSFYRTFDVKSKTWDKEQIYDWWGVIPETFPGKGGTTYSNLFQLSAEDPDGDGHGRIYNFARTKQSPHIMYSDDNGVTWTYGGQFTKQPPGVPTSSYVNGYYKYASNGVDRIDVIATEFHPRDMNTSLYHAYIQDGKLHDATGKVIDDNVFDLTESFNEEKLCSTEDFTTIFKAGPDKNSRVWNSDIQVYADGSISVLFKARAGRFGNHSEGADDHRVWIARFNPETSKWATHEVAKAGKQLFPGNETDYTGLGALVPNDPNTIYISTEVNPLTDKWTKCHEIYRGRTTDNGATWSWNAVTENSSFDNLRPIVPAWNADNTALIWWRGTMQRSQHFDTAVLGIIDRKNETVSPVRYSEVAADKQSKGTSVKAVEAGTYDLFAYFWGNADLSAELIVGLSGQNSMHFRQRVAQQAEVNQFASEVALRKDGQSLYRVYLGRVSASAGEVSNVVVKQGKLAGVGHARVSTK